MYILFRIGGTRGYKTVFKKLDNEIFKITVKTIGTLINVMLLFVSQYNYIIIYLQRAQLVGE